MIKEGEYSKTLFPHLYTDIHMMIKRLLNILVFISIYGCTSARQGYSELEDILDFNINPASGKLIGWLSTTPAKQEISGKWEYPVLKDGRKALSLTIMPTHDRIDIGLTTGFLMPIMDNTVDSTEVTFMGKNEGFDKMQLTFTGYSAQGKLVLADTLHITETEDWDKFTMKIPVKDVSYLHLFLAMHGNRKNVAYTAGLDKIQLTAGGKSLTDYSQRNLYQEFVPDTSEMVKLAFDDLSSYRQIQLLNTPKVVAVGESLHGSETLSDVAIQLMKNRILYNNCKLVLLEIPFERMLSVNRFVQGDTRFPLDMIAQSLGIGLFSKKLLDFFVWVKEYNRTAERKVFVLGLDTMSTDMFTYQTDMTGYFYHVNKEAMNDSIKQFLSLHFVDSRKAMKEVFPIIKNNADFKRNHDASELKIIEHCWTDWLTRVSGEESYYAHRDSLMYSNIKYMINLLCDSSETVTLYSHLEHACRDKTHAISYYPPRPCGVLLKEDFGRDYYALGLFVRQGDVLHLPRLDKKNTYKPRNLQFVKDTLRVPGNNYLESLLSKFEYPYFYVPATVVSLAPLYIRIGSNNGQATNVLYPRDCLDGIIYVEESKAMHIVEEDMPMLEKGKRLMKRFDQYEILLRVQ